MSGAWIVLQGSPLLWLGATFAAFLVGRALNRAVGGAPLANPVLVAIAIIVAALVLTATPYSRYFAGAGLLNLMLAPTTVALAVPFVVNIERVTRSAVGVGLAVLAGSLSATVSGVVLVRLFGGSRETALSMAPKSVTTPIAMSVAAELGGSAALSAVFAILGGIVAAMTVESVLRRAGVDDQRAQGLAAGVAGSGIGAAHIAAVSETAAAFAALGIALNGVITALLTPLVVRWL